MRSSRSQLAAGLGPRRELQLWQAGVARWEDYPAGEDGRARWRGSAAAERTLRRALRAASAALAARDVGLLAEQLPSTEHWRLFGAFGEDAAYLDIETRDTTSSTCAR